MPSPWVPEGRIEHIHTRIELDGALLSTRAVPLLWHPDPPGFPLRLWWLLVCPGCLTLLRHPRCAVVLVGEHAGEEAVVKGRTSE